MTARVTVIAGGVGAARLLRGMQDVVAAEHLTAIVNTGDDTVLHGLYISPDLDTVTYTVSESIDPERGWGLADESWRAIDSLRRYASVLPEGSSAGATWFSLGDRDLATHMYRTGRLAEGATLTVVTDEIRRAWGVPFQILPMSDKRVSTLLTLADDGTQVAFQDYFVRLRHSVEISSVDFRHDNADLAIDAEHAISNADVIVIAPSNPLVSIGPIRALPQTDPLLRQRRDRTVAVSPIVGGAALKGPADRMMRELLDIEPSVVGVAELYREIASTLIIDSVDADLAPAVERAGMRCVVAPSIMRSREHARALSKVCLDAVR